MSQSGILPSSAHRQLRLISISSGDLCKKASAYRLITLASDQKSLYLRHQAMDSNNLVVLPEKEIAYERKIRRHR